MSDQLVAETATYTAHNKHNRRTTTSPAGFEPAIPTIRRLRHYALGRRPPKLGPKLITGPYSKPQETTPYTKTACC